SHFKHHGPHRRPLKWGLGLLAAFIILAAALVGLFRVAANLVPRYHGDIEHMVVTQLGAPVSLGRISLAWRGWGPALLVHDVSVRNATDGQVVLGAKILRLDFSPWAFFHGTGARPSAFGLVQPRLLLKQMPDGQLVVPGLKLKQGSGPSPLKSMLGDAIYVRDGQVRIELAGPHPTAWTVGAIQLKVGSGLLHRVRFSAALGNGTLQVQGDVHTPDAKIARWQWRGNFGLDRLRLGSLARFLPKQAPRIAGNVAVQGRLIGTGAQLATATGQLQAKGLTAGGSRIVHMSSDFEYASGAQQVLTLTQPQITFAQRTWEPGTVRFAHDQTGRLHFGMQNAQLNVVPLLVGFLPASQAALGKRLVAMKPGGNVRNLHFSLTPGKADFGMTGALQDVSLAHVKNTPGAEHVSAQIDIHHGIGVVHLDAPGLTLLLPHLFGHPLALDSAQGEVLVASTAEGLRVGLPRLRLTGPALEGELEGLIDVPHEGPVFIRLAAHTSGTNVIAARTHYLPHGLLSKPLDKWLMSSLSGGRITGATLHFDGPVNTFPYRHGGGYFGVDFGYANVTLSPGWGWTPLKNLSGRVRFENAGMRATITSGNVSGAHVVSGSADIPSFFKLHLLVKADVAGGADNFLTFLRTSPIAGQLGGAFDRVHATGPTRTQLTMNLPIMHPKRFELAGTLLMHGVEANYTGLPFALKDLTGSEQFDAKGPLGGKFEAHLDGAPVTLQVARSAKDEAVRATLTGALPATALKSFLPSTLSDDFTGHLPLHIALNASLKQNGPPVTLDVDSDLQGLAIRLPAPLGKPATTAVPLSTQIVIHGSKLVIAMRYGRVLSGCASIDANANVPAVRGLHLLLGAAGCKRPASGLRFSGTWPRLALNPWFKLLSKLHFSATGGSDGDRLDGLQLNLHFGELKLFGQTLHNQTVSGRLGEQRMLLSLAGDELQVKVVLPRQPSNADPIVAEVTRARFTLTKKPIVAPPAASTPSTATTVQAVSVASLARPATTAVTAATQTLPAAATRTKSEAADNGLRPQDFPPFVLHADHVSLGKASFDNVLVRLRRLTSGIEINPLSIGGGTLDFNGTVVWVKPGGQAGHGQGAVKFLAHVHHLGDLLEGIGIGPVFTGHGAVSASVAWSESRSQGAHLTDQLLGAVSTDLRDGAISKVSPGAGRLLSLLNLANLPRYLTFNFHNLTGKGFPFSRIHGNYTIDQGIASTKGLDIDSSVADIKLIGEMDLDNETLNQRAQIEPNYTGSLPIIGALIGGLGVGAAIFAFTKIFGSAIAHATQLNYSITGPFSNPTVKRVGSKPAPPAATRARAATAGGVHP
ncbi:MAG: YhdP family protein, partial [Gammaproteobacteria bacterium]